MRHMLLLAALIAPLVFGSATSANAATCAAGDALFNGVSGANVTVSTSCVFVPGANNDTNYITSSTMLFDKSNWLLADKSDANSNDNLKPFFLTGVHNNQTSGSWTINPGSVASLSNYIFFVTLKAGSDGFAAYLVSGTSGLWTTDGVLENQNGNARGLSHMSLYYQLAPTYAVPGPIAGAGIPALLALGGFVWARRRKAAAATA